MITAKAPGYPQAVAQRKLAAFSQEAEPEKVALRGKPWEMKAHRVDPSGGVGASVSAPTRQYWNELFALSKYSTRSALRLSWRRTRRRGMHLVIRRYEDRQYTKGLGGQTTDRLVASTAQTFLTWRWRTAAGHQVVPRRDTAGRLADQPEVYARSTTASLFPLRPRPSCKTTSRPRAGAVDYGVPSHYRVAAVSGTYCAGMVLRQTGCN